jgi:hypothetical protein
MEKRALGLHACRACYPRCHLQVPLSMYLYAMTIKPCTDFNEMLEDMQTCEVTWPLT